MRTPALILIALSLSAEAPPAELEQFNQALQGSHFNAAAAALNKVIVKRSPADGQPRQDAVLNSMLGRLYLSAQQVSPGGTFLTHSPLEALPPEMRFDTALALARVLETRGDRPGSIAAYRAAALGVANETQRRQTVLGIARQLIISDPAAVEGDLRPIADGAPGPDRWEANYLLATSASLRGDWQMAGQFAGRAWADAVLAPPSALAPLHVATLRAGLAASQHDLAAERAMLLATNGLAAVGTTSLRGQLPVCGDDGLRPSDFIIIGIVTGPYSTQKVIPISASRPAVVAPFVDRLAGYPLIEKGSYSGAKATIATLSCRTLVSGNYVAKPVFDDPLLAWFVEHGMYSATATNSSEDENVNAVAARIDDLAHRFGKESALLIAPRWQLLGLLQIRANAGDQIPAGQLTDLRKDIAGGLRRAGAPSWLTQPLEASSRFAQVSQLESPADQLSAWEDISRAVLLSVPFDIGRSLLSDMMSKIQGNMPPQVSRLVLVLDSRAPASLAGRERQAWLLTVAQAQQVLGKSADAMATVKAAGISADSCAAAESGPDLLEHHFSYRDYPDDLIAGEQEGATLFEFGVLPTGGVSSPRLVLSLPSLLFDDVSAKGIAALRYVPATRGGKKISCRGQSQPVIWRLEDENDFAVPSLTTGVEAPTT